MTCVPCVNIEALNIRRRDVDGTDIMKKTEQPCVMVGTCTYTIERHTHTHVD